jgi:hypothetical protein
MFDGGELAAIEKIGVSSEILIPGAAVVVWVYHLENFGSSDVDDFGVGWVGLHGG